MSARNYIVSGLKKQAVEFYIQGFSASDIQKKMNLNHSVRQIQRWMKQAEVIRTSAESFRLAISQGKVKFHTNPNKVKRKKLSDKLRAQVLQRDNYRCVQCGAMAHDERLQIDHRNEDKNDNRLENLQVLCESCNKGKAYLSNPRFQ